MCITFYLIFFSKNMTLSVLLSSKYFILILFNIFKGKSFPFFIENRVCKSKWFSSCEKARRYDESQLNQWRFRWILERYCLVLCKLSSSAFQSGTCALTDMILITTKPSVTHQLTRLQSKLLMLRNT